MRFVLNSIILIFTFSLCQAQTLKKRHVKRLIEGSEILRGHHVGFQIKELNKDKPVYSWQADKYFTPASNTKLFTFYAGLKMLRDSVPGLQIRETADSLFIYAAGDPTLLHPNFAQPLIRRLQQSPKPLAWKAGRYQNEFYGVGWSYDDYNEYYQPEISELPLYGNVLRFRMNNQNLEHHPQHPDFVFATGPASTRFRLSRELQSNRFVTPSEAKPAATYSQVVPFKTSDALTVSLLQASAGKPITISRWDNPAATELRTWYSVHRDTLFKHMLQPSDNHMAEQLLLTYAVANGLEMNTAKVINHVVSNYLKDLPHPPQWVDGSGLSRQNLFTPASMVKLAEKIYAEVGDRQRLFDMLPQGGRSGTLRNLYKADQPFVFAKTGSLSNNHNLTGYLVTRKGRTYVFSFMHNNFVKPTAEVRGEMERILTQIHQGF